MICLSIYGPMTENKNIRVWGAVNGFSNFFSTIFIGNGCHSWRPAQILKRAGKSGSSSVLRSYPTIAAQWPAWTTEERFPGIRLTRRNAQLDSHFMCLKPKFGAPLRHPGQTA
jgi:hypothetical protein